MLHKLLTTATKIGQIRVLAIEDDDESSGSSRRRSSGKTLGQRSITKGNSHGVDEDGDVKMASESSIADLSATKTERHEIKNEEGDVEVNVDVVIDYYMLSRRHRASLLRRR